MNKDMIVTNRYIISEMKGYIDAFSGIGNWFWKTTGKVTAAECVNFLIENPKSYILLTGAIRIVFVHDLVNRLKEFDLLNRCVVISNTSVKSWEVK